MNKILSRLNIYLLSTLLVSACAQNTLISQPIRTVQHPGKYSLEYHTPPQEFPSYYSMATVDGREFLVTGDVVIPSTQSLYLLSHWKIERGETVLDIGTGSGVQAVFAADTASKVVATDINPTAIKMTQLNAKRNGVSNLIDTRQGDLFSPIKTNEKFDVILFNIEYPYNEKTQGLWKVHERFFSQVNKYLNKDGRIYYQSGNLDNVPRINHLANNNGLSIISVRMNLAPEVDKQPIVYLIKRSNPPMEKTSALQK